MSSTTKNFSAILLLIQYNSPLKSNKFTKKSDHKILNQRVLLSCGIPQRPEDKPSCRFHLRSRQHRPFRIFRALPGARKKKPQLHCRLRFSFFSGTRGYLTQYSTLSKNPSAVSEELRSPRRRRHVPSFSPVYSFTSAGTANSNEYSFHSGSSLNMISL